MDISQQALNEAKKVAKNNSKFICKSALNLKDIDVYDIIIINHVLYHIDKMIKKF
jgi:2-polyprenyl-3-methyl-5-hydroxy-6-metoxy-1,4-benzoquinol methylase